MRFTNYKLPNFSSFFYHVQKLDGFYCTIKQNFILYLCIYLSIYLYLYIFLYIHLFLLIYLISNKSNKSVLYWTINQNVAFCLFIWKKLFLKKTFFKSKLNIQLYNFFLSLNHYIYNMFCSFTYLLFIFFSVLCLIVLWIYLLRL